MQKLSRFHCAFGIAVLLGANAFAAPPRVFDDAREGIQFAKQDGGNRLILFLLLDGKSDESNKMASLLRGELVLLGNEFVIVQGSTANAADRALFSGRFRQDITQAPLAVIADAGGNLVAAPEGRDREHFQAMIESARLKAGFIKPEDRKVAGEKAAERVGGEVIAMKKDDLDEEKLLMTKYRPWLLADGTSFRAALLEAKGDKGIFVLERDKKHVEVEFAKLSPSDLAFLSSVLGASGQ